MIRKEPVHARRAREALSEKVTYSRRRKRRAKAKRKRQANPVPPAKTWEQLEIERLKHSQRVAEDEQIGRFVNDVLSTQLSNQAVLVACEVTERHQQCTLAIPIFHLRTLCAIIKDRLGPTVGAPT